MKRRKRAVKKGPLSALGWKRAFHNPNTGAELSGNWVYPDSQAVQRAAQSCATSSQKKVFRDSATGVKSARKVGLV